ncbi:MAG: DUF2007 domain-containing protein [Anaerolineae bacterium]|nr:DUF2007 domain-containing protein [Anaerolineae bacterium]
MNTQPEWIVIYSTHDYAEAHVIAGRLQVEGIRAMVHQQSGAAAFGITVGILGEITVLVHPKDEERALDILEPAEPDALPDTLDDIHYHVDDDQ